mmetsp:Transcript_88755/g.246549  ORF Transcript_88755/g.246549 Transcript_88755/m.246549 type:complete len:205 (-) Transcript_88755:224-838(-)
MTGRGSREGLVKRARTQPKLPDCRTWSGAGGRCHTKWLLWCARSRASVQPSQLQHNSQQRSFQRRYLHEPKGGEPSPMPPGLTRARLRQCRARRHCAREDHARSWQSNDRDRLPPQWCQSDASGWTAQPAPEHTELLWQPCCTSWSPGHQPNRYRPLAPPLSRTGRPRQGFLPSRHSSRRHPSGGCTVPRARGQCRCNEPGHLA